MSSWCARRRDIVFEITNESILKCNTFGTIVVYVKRTWNFKWFLSHYVPELHGKRISTDFRSHEHCYELISYLKYFVQFSAPQEVFGESRDFWSQLEEGRLETVSYTKWRMPLENKSLSEHRNCNNNVPFSRS